MTTATFPASPPAPAQGGSAPPASPGAVPSPAAAVWRPCGPAAAHIRRFTVDEYHRLVASGFFPDDYARAGIAVYWLVDLVERRVEVYTDPSGPDPAPAYRRREDYTLGRSIPLTIGGIVVPAVPVADLLPGSSSRP